MDVRFEIEMEALRPIHAGRLVGDDGQPQYTACVSSAPHATELYVDGYRLAALRLIADLGIDQDFLVYPALFLFRHYLELRLKGIIEVGEALSPAPSTVTGGHDLRQLWSVAEKHLRREYRECSERKDFLEDLRAASELVQEFIELDPGPSGTAFRYARRRDGSSALPAHLVRINLQQFAAGMAHLAHFLDAAMCGMSAELELKEDFESEFGCI